MEPDAKTSFHYWVLNHVFSLSMNSGTLADQLLFPFPINQHGEQFQMPTATRYYQVPHLEIQVDNGKNIGLQYPIVFRYVSVPQVITLPSRKEIS